MQHSFSLGIWSPKGGVGKTTLALNLAAAARSLGKSVVVFDLDPQQSAVDVFNDKKLSFTVLKGMPSIKPRADIMIYDMPPRIDVAIEGNNILIPMRASILDIRAVNRAIKHVMHKRIVKCVNAVDTRRQDERMLAMRMYAEGARLIKDRSIYSRAISQGKTVFDINVYGADEARTEVKALLHYILGEERPVAEE